MTKVHEAEPLLRSALSRSRRAGAMLDEEVGRAGEGGPDYSKVDRALRDLAQARVSIELALHILRRARRTPPGDGTEGDGTERRAGIAAMVAADAEAMAKGKGDTLWDRLGLARQHAGFASWGAYAARAGVDLELLQEIIAAEPGQQSATGRGVAVVYAFAAAAAVDPIWLAVGAGTMLPARQVGALTVLPGGKS